MQLELERRENPRYCINMPAVLHLKDKDKSNDMAINVKDMSITGARVYLSEKIRLTKSMYLEIAPALSPSNSVLLPVRSEWDDSKREEQTYAFSFRDLSDEQKQKLLLYLKNFELNINERRIQQRRTKVDETPSDKRDKERRISYPYLLKCHRMSRYKKLMNKDAYAYLREIESGSRNTIVVGGKKLINFGSNNYLGLTTHPAVVEAGIKAAEKYGIGSGGVRVLSGTMDLHNQLERKLAEFKGGEDCVIFSTGYTTNIGAISLLSNKNDYLIVDEKSHASIIDGCHLSDAEMVVFRHNSMHDLERKLKKIDISAPKLIITDGVFSMDGDIAKLDEIYALGREYKAAVMVDDAHATGVIGKQGRGTASHFGLDGKISIVAGTMSKALGAIGGFVVSNKTVIHCLKHFCRGFIFTTSLPPLVSASVLKAIEIIETDEQLLNRLWQNIKYVKNELLNAGFNLGNTETAIIPVIIGEEITTYKFTTVLQENGIFASPVGYPAVRKREERIRLSVMATHTDSDLEFLVNKLITLGKQFRII